VQDLKADTTSQIPFNQECVMLRGVSASI